jgi:hypothetical protein
VLSKEKAGPGEKDRGPLMGEDSKHCSHVALVGANDHMTNLPQADSTNPEKKAEADRLEKARAWLRVARGQDPPPGETLDLFPDESVPQ